MPTRRKVLVALLDQSHPFQRAQADAARAAAERYELDVEVLFAASNPVLQVQQIEERLSLPGARRPAAVVVDAVTASGLEQTARQAVRAGVGWVLVSDQAAYLDQLRTEVAGCLVASTVSDNEEAGRVQGRICQRLLPHGGRILCVEGTDSHPAAIHRRVGLQQALQGTKVQVLRAINGEWNREVAKRAVSLWLRLCARASPPALVLAQNDEMAQGARDALCAVRPDLARLPVVGCDGLVASGQALVRARVLDATVVIPPPAGLGVELVARSLRGEPIPPCTLVPLRSFPELAELAA